MWSVLLFVACSIASSYAERPSPLPPICKLPLDRGQFCSENEPTIRYHMDPETLACLAFEHKGCGGNANSFSSKGECSQRCIPADYLMCAANEPPVRRENGDSSCHGNLLLPLGLSLSTPSPCPAGSSCHVGFAVGICCDDAASAAVSANYKPDCGPGKKPFKSEQYGFQLIHLGKSCENDFCPINSTCHQGTYYAYCCH